VAKVTQALMVMSMSLGLALAGCGDDSESVDMGQVDMGQDLSAAGTSCSVLAACILGAGGDVPTIQACIAKGSTKAMMLYGAVKACGYMICTMCAGVDSGTCLPVCSSTTDSSAGCVSCVQTMSQSSCSTELNACLADK